MKRLIPILTALLFATAVHANDGTFYAKGNILVPIHETDISIFREVLTISIGLDRYATVDVYYEFFNPKAEKTVTMAFEADAPQSPGVPLNRDGTHPFIQDFTVTMNGESLPCRNSVFTWNRERKADYTPLDLEKWICNMDYVNEQEDPELLCDGNELYNEELDSFVCFAYGYFFNATFKEGLNTVHHTYRYHMNETVMADFQLPYWLTPAARWAGGKIGDFTLRITGPAGTGICMENSPFAEEQWKPSPTLYFFSNGESRYMLATLIGNPIEWHARDFVPDRNIMIYAEDMIGGHRHYYDPMARVVVEDDSHVCLYMGEDGDHYFVEAQDYGWVDKRTGHIETYSAKDGQGYITARGFDPVSVRKEPAEDSPVIYSIRDTPGELPQVFECLGYYSVRSYGDWFKIDVEGKAGYVKSYLVEWSPLNLW